MRALLGLLGLALAACGGTAAHTEVPVAPAAAPTSFVESRIDAVHGAFVASLDLAVTSFGAAVAPSGQLYVAGGYFGRPHDYDREGQSSELMRLGASGAWETRAAMFESLQGFALVPREGGLLRCGGSHIANARGEPTDMRSIATCRQYVEAGDTWVPFPDMPEPRSSFDAAVLDGRVYAIGGWRLDGDATHGTFATEMMVLDATLGTWSTEPAPVERRALAVVATTRAVVAIGGLEGSLHASTAVDIYDPSSHAWSHGPDFPGEGFGMAAAAIGDVIYASGSDGVVYRWSIGDAAWAPFAALAQPRFFHRLVPVGDALYAIGGIGSMTMDGRARLIESIATSTPSRALGWVDLDFPGRARNRFAMFAVDDSLYVVGGNDSPAQHDFAPTNFVAEAFRLHVPSLRWYALPPLPEARQSLEAVRVGEERVALLGGFGHDGHAARTFADAFVTDGSTFTIAHGALPAGRTQFGTTLHDGAIWIFAGLVFDESLPEEQQFTHLDDVLRCPVTPSGVISTCETIAVHLPGTRRAFASAALDGHFFIAGGMRDGFAPVDDCFDFDFAARAFAGVSCPSHVRISGAMLAHDGHLYLVGGSSSGAGGLQADRSIEVFDPSTHAWSTLIAELPFDTHQARWAFVGDRLAMLATQHDAGHATLALIDVR
jgi:hypothetical protein